MPDLLRKPEDRGQQLRDEAASAADQNPRKESDKQANKLIEDAASKGSFAKIAAQKGAESIKKTGENKAVQLVKEADTQALKLVEEAKAKRDEMVNKF